MSNVNYYLQGFNEYSEQQSQYASDKSHFLAKSDEQFQNEVRHGNLRLENIEKMNDVGVLTENQKEFTRQFFEDSDLF